MFVVYGMSNSTAIVYVCVCGCGINGEGGTPTVLPASRATEGEESVEGGMCEGVRCDGVDVC